MAWWDPLSWVSDLVNNFIAAPIQNLLSNIAGGIETGIVSVIGDVWKVVLPFAEIAGGIIIIIIALMIGLGGSNLGQTALFGAARVGSFIAK